MTDRSDPEYVDDAIHLRDPARPERTLCDLDAYPRNIARPWEFREDESECWTCALRREQQRVA